MHRAGSVQRRTSLPHAPLFMPVNLPPRRKFLTAEGAGNAEAFEETFLCDLCVLCGKKTIVNGYTMPLQSLLDAD
jgi:hypothetical protein